MLCDSTGLIDHSPSSEILRQRSVGELGARAPYKYFDTGRLGAPSLARSSSWLSVG
jgi:hypothetical protein